MEGAERDAEEEALSAVAEAGTKASSSMWGKKLLSQTMEEKKAELEVEAKKSGWSTSMLRAKIAEAEEVALAAESAATTATKSKSSVPTGDTDDDTDDEPPLESAASAEMMDGDTSGSEMTSVSSVSDVSMTESEPEEEPEDGEDDDLSTTTSEEEEREEALSAVAEAGTRASSGMWGKKLLSQTMEEKKAELEVEAKKSGWSTSMLRAKIAEAEEVALAAESAATTATKSKSSDMSKHAPEGLSEDPDDTVAFIERTYDDISLHDKSASLANEGTEMYKVGRQELKQRKAKAQRDAKMRQRAHAISSSDEDEDDEEALSEGAKHLQKFRDAEHNQERNAAAQKAAEASAAAREKMRQAEMEIEGQERAELVEEDLEDPTVQFRRARQERNAKIAQERQARLEAEKRKVEEDALAAAAEEATKQRLEAELGVTKRALAKKAADRRRKKVSKGCIDAGSSPKPWLGFLADYTEDADRRDRTAAP